MNLKLQMAYKHYFKFYFYFICLCCQFCTNAIAQPTPNHVIIVGTKHNGSKQLTSKNLYQLISKIKPDIILLEYDSTTVADCNIQKVWGAKTAEFLGIWKNPIEYKAARKYKEKVKEVCLASYDIYIPNRSKYVSYKYAMEESHSFSMTQLFNDNKFTSIDSIQFNDYNLLNKSLIQRLDSNLIIINRESLNDTAKKVFEIEKTFIKNITEKYIELKPYSNWFNADILFWEERNKKMCAQITRELNANSDKTILIITGLMHKYYLSNYLQQKELEKLCKLIPLSQIMN